MPVPAFTVNKGAGPLPQQAAAGCWHPWPSEVLSNSTIQLPAHIRPMQFVTPASRPGWATSAAAAATPPAGGGSAAAVAAEDACSPRAAAACEGRMWFSEGLYY